MLTAWHCICGFSLILKPCKWRAQHPASDFSTEREAGMITSNPVQLTELTLGYEIWVFQASFLPGVMPPSGPCTVVQTEYCTEAPRPAGTWGWNPAHALLAKTAIVTWSCNCPEERTPFSLTISTIYVGSGPVTGRKEEATGIMKALNLLILAVGVYSKEIQQTIQNSKIFWAYRLSTVLLICNPINSNSKHLHNIYNKRGALREDRPKKQTKREKELYAIEQVLFYLLIYVMCYILMTYKELILHFTDQKNSLRMLI